MKLTKALELEKTLISRVKESYRETVHFESNLDQHIERIKKHVYETREFQRAPEWVKHATRTVDSVLWEMLYATSWTFKSRKLTPEALPVLASVSIGPDGRKFGEQDDSWLNTSNEYKAELTCQHVWRSAWNRGDWKPF